MNDWKVIAEENGINPRTFLSRVKDGGWSPERAATTPVQKRKKRTPSEIAELKKWREVAVTNGISEEAFNTRICKGMDWSLEKAATEPVNKKMQRDDLEWVELAKRNGIPYPVYVSRVDSYFWNPEDAATIPILTVEEVNERRRNGLEEYVELRRNRILNDANNLFNIIPHHYKVAKENNIPRGTVKTRVYNLGWTVHEAITTPVMYNDDKYEAYRKMKQLAVENGINSGNFYSRVNRGWSLEKAATQPLRLKASRTVYREEDVEKAAKSGVSYDLFRERVALLGWSTEEAATIPRLKPGQFSNEERSQRAIEGLKEFRNFRKK